MTNSSKYLLPLVLSNSISSFFLTSSFSSQGVWFRSQEAGQHGRERMSLVCRVGPRTTCLCHRQLYQQGHVVTAPIDRHRKPNSEQRHAARSTDKDFNVQSWPRVSRDTNVIFGPSVDAAKILQDILKAIVNVSPWSLLMLLPLYIYRGLYHEEILQPYSAVFGHNSGFLVSWCWLTYNQDGSP